MEQGEQLEAAAHIATLDPLAARQPEGGLYMWSERPAGAGEVGTGARTSPANSSAAGLVSYDVALSAVKKTIT